MSFLAVSGKQLINVTRSVRRSAYGYRQRRQPSDRQTLSHLRQRKRRQHQHC